MPTLTRPFLCIAIALMSSGLWAQQDALFTKYFFNTLSYNPAYAGSREYLSIVGLVREQWVGWGDGNSIAGDGGAPRTQNITIHGPIQERVGIGGSLYNDRVGATSVSGFNFSYAYRIPFGFSKLAIGVNGGFAYWTADWDALKFKDPRDIDPVFAGENPDKWVPAIGAGVYYYSDNFYAGLSVPRLFNYDLRNTEGFSPDILKSAKFYRHYYITTGAAIPVNGDDLVFKPSLLIKGVGLFGDFSASNQNINKVGSPTQFDIDISLLFYQKFWLGVAFRSAFEEVFRELSSHDSADIWFAFYLHNGLRLGAAYDFPLTEIQNYSSGSFELMVGYDFNYKVQKVLTPRYF